MGITESVSESQGKPNTPTPRCDILALTTVLRRQVALLSVQSSLVASLPSQLRLNGKKKWSRPFGLGNTPKLWNIIVTEILRIAMLPSNTNTAYSRTGIRVAPSASQPSCLQTTRASSSPNLSSHAVFQYPWSGTNTSNLPWHLFSPPCNRICLPAACV